MLIRIFSACFFLCDLLVSPAQADIATAVTLPNEIRVRNEAEVYVLSKEERGRHTPFFNDYHPQFYLRTTDITGAVELPEGVEMVMPSDNINFIATLIAPIAMEDGLRFARVAAQLVQACSRKSSSKL